MATRIQQAISIPDLVISEIDGNRFAMYITGAELLNQDLGSKIGVPFLFYTGQDQGFIGQLRRDYTYCIFSSPLELLGEQGVKLEISVPPPKTEQAGVQLTNTGRVPLEELVQFVITPGGGERVFVPYSMGRFGYNETRRNRNVRNKTDYDRIFERVIPTVKRRRAESEFYASRLNSALASLGLRRPPTFSQENPITYSYWSTRTR